MHFNLWHLVHTEHAILVEVRLLHAALLQSDVSPEGRSQAESDSALHLCRDDIRIDRDTTATPAADTVDFDPTRFLNGDLHHLSDKRLESLRHRDSPTLALRQRRRGPTGLLCREFQNGLHAGLFREQLAAKLERVL